MKDVVLEFGGTLVYVSDKYGARAGRLAERSTEAIRKPKLSPVWYVYATVARREGEHIHTRCARFQIFSAARKGNQRE
jgi:hypothetical protein